MAEQTPTGKLPIEGEAHDLIVLAGGAGSRMDNADKGLVTVQGSPLVGRILERLAGSAGHIIISANRNQQAYAAFGDTVVSDRRDGFCGPLAGIEAALAVTRSAACVVMPCDMPALPADLPAALLAGLGADRTAAYLHDGQRAQPLCLALRCQAAAASLAAWLDAGERSVIRWLEQIGAARLDGSHWPADCWLNINDADALEKVNAGP